MWDYCSQEWAFWRAGYRCGGRGRSIHWKLYDTSDRGSLNREGVRVPLPNESKTGAFRRPPSAESLIVALNHTTSGLPVVRQFSVHERRSFDHKLRLRLVSL